MSETPCRETFGDHACNETGEHTTHRAENAGEGGADLVWRGVEERDELGALIRECAELRCAHVGASDCVRAISLAANAERCRWRHKFDGQCIKARRHDGPHEPSDEKRGIYGKYEVRRLNDPTGKHAGCDYYVLDWKHDPFAVPAALAYANACESQFPALAVDLRALAALALRDSAPADWRDDADKLIADLKAPRDSGKEGQ